MYQHIIKLITTIGDQVSQEAGSVKDIGVEKEWLTEKDILVETRLVECIRQFDHDAEVYAEELHNKITYSHSVWIIDPISSTFNFIHGLPGYAVVVSHMIHGQIVFAAVYDPSAKELFTAEKDRGLYLNGKRCHGRSGKDKVVLLSGIRSGKDLDKVKELYDFGVIRTFGSVALHYAYVACGRASIAFTLNKDTFPEFAGQLLVEEGGGVFTDIHNQPLNFESRGIVASSNQAVHDSILKLLENSGEKG